MSRRIDSDGRQQGNGLSLDLSGFIYLAHCSPAPILCGLLGGGIFVSIKPEFEPVETGAHRRQTRSRPMQEVGFVEIDHHLGGDARLLEHLVQFEPIRRGERRVKLWQGAGERGIGSLFAWGRSVPAA